MTTTHYGMPSSDPARYYTCEAGYAAMMRWYARVLNELPVPVNQICIPLDRIETHVLTAGDPSNPPFLLLHGINVNALNWRAQITQLAAEYQVIVPDVPGFAGKSSPVRLPYGAGVDAYTRWLRDLLDALNLAQTFVAGQSAGGYFALKLAAHFPKRVLGAALINPCGIVRYPFPLDFFRQQWCVRLVGMLGRRCMATWHGAEALVRKGASPNQPLDPDTVELAYLLVKYFKRFPPPGPLSAAELAQITAPVYLLLSDHEPYFHRQHMARHAQKVFTHCDLRVEVLTNAGHDAHHDQAELVSACLRHMTRRVLSADD